MNSTGEFSLDTWIANLGLSNLHSSKKLAENWHYCEQKTKNHPEASLLLWRGLEMVEILATLSMDNDSLCAALLFPLVNANLVEEKNLSEKHGKEDIAALI